MGKHDALYEKVDHLYLVCEEQIQINLRLHAQLKQISEMFDALIKRCDYINPPIESDKNGWAISMNIPIRYGENK